MKSRNELSEEADLYAEYIFLRVQEYIFLRIHTRILVCNPLVGLQMSTEKRQNQSDSQRKPCIKKYHLLKKEKGECEKEG